MAKIQSVWGVAMIAIIGIFIISAVDAGQDYGSALGWLPTGSSLSACSNDSVGGCLGEEEEFEFDSEISRRILATRRRYISYGALQRNSVPCSRRGASYYNCKRGAQANPYNRGCSAITRCRR